MVPEPEEEVHPGHEQTLAVGDDILLDERQPGTDQQRTHRRLKLGGRRLVAGIPLLQQPPQLSDAPPARWEAHVPGPPQRHAPASRCSELRVALPTR